LEEKVGVNAKKQVSLSRTATFQAFKCKKRRRGGGGKGGERKGPREK